MTTNLVPKNQNKFYCKLCNYSSSRKSQYDRHMSTEKHKKKEKKIIVSKCQTDVRHCFAAHFSDPSPLSFEYERTAFFEMDNMIAIFSAIIL